MASHKIERINEQLKRELSEILHGEVKDPRIGAVTVTRVVTAPDLTLARAFVQLLGDEEDREESMEGLQAATPFIRGALARRIELRRVPELRFERDRSLEHALRIEALLSEVAPGPEEEPAPEEGENGSAEEADEG